MRAVDAGCPAAQADAGCGDNAHRQWRWRAEVETGNAKVSGADLGLLAFGLGLLIASRMMSRSGRAVKDLPKGHIPLPWQAPPHPMNQVSEDPQERL